MMYIVVVKLLSVLFGKISGVVSTLNDLDYPYDKNCILLMFIKIFYTLKICRTMLK